MRRSLEIIALTLVVYSGSAWAGPGSASGPIAVDSTTFVPGSSVMGTDGGVYSDTLPPVASTTTAAFRMTKYRAQHVNLRDTSGQEIGTAGNPLYTTASSTITIGNVTILNSSFSVTGSTVSIAGTVPVSVAGTVNVAVTGTPTVKVSSTSVSGSTVTITNTGFNVTNTPSVHFADTLPAGTNNIGTVSGSTVTIRNPTGTNLSTTLATALPAGANVIGQVTANQTSPQSLKASVYIAGSSNTVTATQSDGNNLHAKVDNFPATQAVSGTVAATQSGVWTFASNAPAITTVTFNNQSQPVTLTNGGTVSVIQSNPALNQASVSISGSSNTVQAQQSGSWTDTVTQATPANLKASVYIAGSSNTVTATQSGTWTNTVTQATPANLQASVSINGSSNTVAAAQSGSWTATVVQPTASSLRSSVSIDGSSNTVVLGAGTANVGKVAFQAPTTAALTSAAITTNSTGDNVIVSTASSQTVRVFQMIFTVDAATTLKFKSSGATSLSGYMTFTAGGSFAVTFNGEPYYVTAASQAFIINQTGTAQISGTVWYTQS